MQKWLHSELDWRENWANWRPKTQLVRGLAAPHSRRPLELACLVDQQNCGEVYYITWTRQRPQNSANGTAAANNQQQPWTRVYLYTGANDSAPHKPIGDLVNRAQFQMPPPPPALANELIESLPSKPMAKLVIEEPRLSDEALYKCDVTYVKGKCPSISLVRVQMMSLPEKAQILLQTAGQQQQSVTDGQLIGPFNENQQLQLKCLVAGGRPAPQAVVWRRIDSMGRLINLKLNSLHHPAGSTGRSTAGTAPAAASSQQQQLIEVQLNHTLTSADLGAKFECHVEHEALETSSRLARVVSPTSDQSSSSGPSSDIINNNAIQGSRQTADAMLDLHPSLGRQSSLDEEPSALIGQQNQQQQSTRSAGHHLHPALDSHVIVDLNVGVSSVDLFLTKLDNSAGSSAEQQQVRKRNASEPLNEGDLIELECVAYNSKPAANITWLNGSELISYDTELGGASTTTTIMPPPLSFQQNLWPQAAAPTRQSGRQANSRQKRLLQRNQLQLNSDGQTFNTHSFLSIKLSRHEHRSQITCQAQNEPMQKPLARTIELQVQHAPIVLMEPAAGIVTSEYELDHKTQRDETNVIQQHQKNDFPMPTAQMISSYPTSGSGSFAQVNEQVNIYCIYTANPHQLAANSTRWFKDNQLISFDEDQATQQHFSQSTTSNGYPMLTIKQPKRFHSGHYDCQVANSIGASERLPPSESCHLEVNFRPSVRLRLFRVLDRPSDAEDSALLAPLEKRAAFSPDELAELDPQDEVILPGTLIVLQCEVVESKPAKISKFHWSSRSTTNSRDHQHSSSAAATTTTSTSENQLKLGPLEANFRPTSFVCAATNSIGQSEQSNEIDLQLSQTPGPSIVRPVTDLMLRKIILASGRPAHLAASTVTDNDYLPASGAIPTPLQAGTELLLECLTQDLGQPKANKWLWLKDGQPIELASSPNIQATTTNGRLQSPADAAAAKTTNVSEVVVDLGGANTGQDDNPISGRLILTTAYQSQRLPKAENQQQQQDSARLLSRSNSYSENNGHQMKATKLLAAGRYLYVSSIQLAHKGNYSCVAVNRLGSGDVGLANQRKLKESQEANQSINGQQQRDSYQLNVALAPSFVQPLASKTYWSEVQTNQTPTTAAAGDITENTSSSAGEQRLELVCHIQCEPICQIDWLRNNEPLDLGNGAGDAINESAAAARKFVSHRVQQTIRDEHEESNMFRSIESRLVLQFHQATTKQPNQRDPMSRERILERRQLLNGSNYTCQSSPNSMGPAVRSTTQFIIQYPPENVFINSPSDKLNLVEGSNGPRLSCEASGEPQVQFRWFLLPSGNNNNLLASSDLVSTTRYSVKHSAGLRQPSATTSLVKQTARQTRRQPSGASIFHHQSNGTQSAGNNNKLNELTTTTAANDPAADDFGLRPLELAADQVGGVSVGGQTSASTLDLSSMSIDRKQAGHYICEASNKLGRTRQSVYVNVLYKPSAIAVHLHSLDMILEAPIKVGLAEFSKKNGNSDSNNNFIPVKPSQATDQDEYSIVHETSEDFISLRRTLLMSPALNVNQLEGPGGDDVDDDKLAGLHSFRDSIFQTILNDKQQQHGKQTLVRDNNELITSASTEQQQQSNEPASPIVGSNNSSSSSANYVDLLKSMQNEHAGQTWERFNELLLKFLNNYLRQTRQTEEQRSASELMKRLNTRLSRQLTRTGSSNNLDDQAAAFSIDQNQHIEYFGARNLITFACLARDGNPLNNLTFNWAFNSANLNEQQQQQQADSLLSPPPPPDSLKQKPILLYLNRNSTLAIKLIRRLDTKTSLSPFQLSLLTLNVIVLNPNDQQQQHRSSPATSITNRQQNDNDPDRQQSRRQTASPNSDNFMRAPLISKTKYQSVPSEPKAIGEDLHLHRAFSSPLAVELSDQNWQEQLGQLLKCSVGNQIGTSDLVPVRVNLAERRLRNALSSSGAFEFAKWRHLPALAQKSLLILSILIGFMLIVFATIALLIGVNLRQFRFIKTNFVVGNNKRQQQHQNNDGSNSSDHSKDDCATTNTGQSTSSQKSSVLGLLNNGDSSFHGSSDDDNSSGPLSGGQQQQRFVGSKGDTGLVGNHHHHHLGLNAEDHLLSDVHRPPMMTIYKPTNSDAAADQAHAELSAGNKLSHAGNRLLASLKLKSLGKFKVDRISDLQNSINGSLHAKNVSNSETITTGLSNSINDNSEVHNQLRASMTSSEFWPPTGSSLKNNFGHHNLRHSHHQFNQHQQHQLRLQQPATIARQRLTSNNYPITGGHVFNDNYQNPLSLNTQALVDSTLYSNVAFNYHQPNAMDEFMRSRGLDLGDETNLASLSSNQAQTTYRAQSSMLGLNAHNHQSTMFSLRPGVDSSGRMLSNNNPRPLPKAKPPVYPRQLPNGNLYNNRIHSMQRNNINDHYLFQPDLAAPSSLQQQFNSFTAQYDGMNNHQRTSTRLDTIDSHLNRLSIDGVALVGDYNQQQAYANAMELQRQTSSNQLRYSDSLVNQQQIRHHDSRLDESQQQHPLQSHASPEHIYDLNAYATPEQTPLRRPTNPNNSSSAQSNESERPRVSQLIQSFNSKLPEQQQP